MVATGCWGSWQLAVQLQQHSCATIGTGSVVRDNFPGSPNPAGGGGWVPAAWTSCCCCCMHVHWVGGLAVGVESCVSLHLLLTWEAAPHHAAHIACCCCCRQHTGVEQRQGDAGQGSHVSLHGQRVGEGALGGCIVRGGDLQGGQGGVSGTPGLGVRTPCVVQTAW